MVIDLRALVEQAPNLKSLELSCSCMNFSQLEAYLPDDIEELKHDICPSSIIMETKFAGEELQLLRSIGFTFQRLGRDRYIATCKDPVDSLNKQECAEQASCLLRISQDRVSNHMINKYLQDVIEAPMCMS